MDELTDLEVSVLYDMLEEWWDKDRHGDLNGGWGYDEYHQEALETLGEKIVSQAKRRKIIYV